MRHRCGWATNAGQEHLPAIEITRAGLERALTRGPPRPRVPRRLW